MIKNNVSKIIKTICSIIQTKIPKKIEKLEEKFWIWIHTCNFENTIRLSNKETLKISVNVYLDNSKNDNWAISTKWNTYDVWIWDKENVFISNYSGDYNEYSHDLENDSEYFEIMEKVCGIINKGTEKKRE